MQQITRGDYLKDLITIYIENNLQTDITELYNQFIFQCGEIQKVLTPAQVIKISFDEIESQLLKSTNTCYLAGITTDGHKETFNGSLTFNTRGEVVYYEPPVSTVIPAATETNCDCHGLRGVFSNCTQPAIKAYFSLNYVPTKLSELQNDTDFVDSFDLTRAVSEHNTSTEAHQYIQDLVATEASLRASQTNALGIIIGTEESVRASQTEALHQSILAEATARDEAISLAISTTEGYADTQISNHNSSEQAHPYIQSALVSATEAINVTIGDLDNLDTSNKSSVVNAINSEVTARENADNNLQTQIDGLAAASDVTDIVGTYAELQAYDTSHLNNNDIIKVLSDETHDDEPSYYRFNKTAGTFSYIGSESAAYTKAQSDSIFVTQTTEINGHALSSDINLTPSDIGALSDSYATVISANTSAIATNTSAIASNTSVIAQHTTAIASNTSDISTINGKIPTDASTTNKLVSASTLSASISDFANQDLSNLTANGEGRLHALKAYADEGELLTDADGLAFVKNYAHSTFDRSKFTVVGSPNITDDGIASGFSGSNYLSIGEISLGQTFEIDCVYTSPAITSGTSYFWCMKGSAQKLGFCRTSSAFELLVGNGSSWVIDVSGSYVFSPSTLYYLKVIFDGTKYVVKVSIDKENWTTIISQDSTQVVPDGEFIVGRARTTDYAYPLQGSIDLKQFSVTVDGAEVFSGNKTGIDTIKPDDYTVVGTPTISADGVASGFSGSGTLLPTDYIVAPVSFSSASDFDIVIKNFTVSGSTSQRILTGLTSSDTELYCYIYRPQNSSGISFVFGQGNGGIVYCGITEGNTLNCKLSKRGNVLTWDVENVTKSNHPAPTVVNYTATDFTVDKILLGGGWVAWEGTIDLNGFEVYVDGDLVYQPCLKIPYTESKTGSKIVNSIYRDRVNDMASLFGYAPYYTLDESNGNFTLPQVELYGNIQQTLRNSTINGVNKNYLYSNRMQIQTGSCTSGVEVTLPTPFSDSNYALTVPYSAKSATAFTPTATGDWIAIGLGNL